MANLTIDEYKAISEGVVSALKKAGAISTSGARPPTSPGGSSSSGLPSGNFKKQYGALRDSQNTLLDSMHYASKSNLDLANKLNGLGALTEKVTNNAHLDSMVNSIMGMSKSFADSGNKIAAAFNTEMMKDGEVNLKDLFDRLAPMAAAVKNTTKRFEDAGTSLDDLINSNVSAMTSSDNNYQLLLASAKEFGSNLSDQNKDILKKMEAGTDITGAELRKLSKDVKEAHEATSTFVKKMDENGRKALVKGLAAQGATQAFTSMLNINTLSIGALLAVFGKGLIGAWQQFRAIAAAGMSHHFEEIVASSIKLGISSEKLTEMFKQNSLTLLKVGSGDFVERINKAQNGLVELGLGLEEAANAANGFHKNAIAAGVDPKNTNAINKSMEQQTAAFAKLRAVTGVTAEEFNSLNAQILSNVENQTLSLRLAPEERHARFQELVGLQQEFAQRGLNAQAANQMMQAMQSFSKNRLKDRLEGAARMQQLGGMLGMGAEGARAGELMRKRKRSASEEAELAGISGNLKGALEQFGNQGMGFENAADVMEDNMGNAAKGLLDASIQLKLASDSMMGIKDGEVDKAVDASKLNPNTQAVIKAQDIATNALKTPLWLLVGSVGGILALMIKSAKFGSMIDVLKNKASGARSRVAGAGSKVGTAIKDGFTFLVEKMKNFGMPRLTPSFGSGMMSSMKGLFTTLMSGVTKAGGVMKTVFGSIRTFLGIVSKAIVPIGIVVSLVTSLYEVFTKFGESLHFDSLGATLMSLGGILMNAVKVFFVDGVSLIGDIILGGISWIVKGLFGPLDEALANAKDQWKNWGADIDKWWNGFMGGFLSYFRSDEEKAKTAKEVKKANDEVDASIKKSTKSTVDQTKALENKVSTEKYLGMSGGFDSVSSASLVNDVQKSKINDALVNGTNDKKSTINKETSGTSPTSNTAATSTETGTVTTTTPTNITLADVHKVLLELLNETVTGTDEIVDGLVKLKPSGSKFTQPSRTLMVQT
jgi:hypothetical protein